MDEKSRVSPQQEFENRYSRVLLLLECAGSFREAPGRNCTFLPIRYLAKGKQQFVGSRLDRASTTASQKASAKWK
ncbi:unnamed protein product, partial [Iphiclides podalirius]